MSPFRAPPLPPQEVQHGDPSTLDPLHVVTCISNPVRWNSRTQLYREFAHRVADAGGILTTVELQQGERPFAVTDPDNPFHHQFRTRAEMWHKENMLNLAIARLPADWKYVAWVDADVSFTNPHWVNETIQQLQNYKMVQMFNWATDLGPDYAPLPGGQHRGFVYGYTLNPEEKPVAGPGGGQYPYGVPGTGGSRYHPGYAWATHRHVLDALGGLIDFAVLGSADYHMAQALVHNAESSLYKGINANYEQGVMAWQERADRYVKLNIGYVETALVHYWHGKKKNRNYWQRNKILVDNDYNPVTDIIRDTAGVLGLGGNKNALRDGIKGYFRQRLEDSLEN